MVVQNEGKSRPTAKGADRSIPKTLDLVIMNSSGKPQLLAAIEVNAGAKVVLNQEHHCHGGALADLQHDAKPLG